MELVRTTLVVEVCKEHIEHVEARGTPIESYLVQHVLVVLCAEIEEFVRSCVEERVARVGDDEITRFAVNSAKKLIRSVTKKDLADLLKNFSSEVQDRFNVAVDDRDVTLFGNAVGHRHGVAHGAGSQMTLTELEGSLAAAGRVLSAFASALR